MKCPQVQDMLNAYLDRELFADEARGVEAHLSACPSCAQELAALRETVRLCRFLGDSPLPADFHASLMQRVTALAAAGQGPAAIPSAADRARPGAGLPWSLAWLRRTWAAAAAAVVAVAIGLGTWSVGRVPSPVATSDAPLTIASQPGSGSVNTTPNGTQPTANGNGPNGGANNGQPAAPNANPNASNTVATTTPGDGERTTTPTDGSARNGSEQTTPNRTVAVAPTGASDASATAVDVQDDASKPGSPPTTRVPTTAGFPPLRTFTAVTVAPRPENNLIVSTFRFEIETTRVEEIKSAIASVAAAGGGSVQSGAVVGPSEASGYEIAFVVGNGQRDAVMAQLQTLASRANRLSIGRSDVNIAAQISAVRSELEFQRARVAELPENSAERAAVALRMSQLEARDAELVRTLQQTRFEAVIRRVN